MKNAIPIILFLIIFQSAAFPQQNIMERAEQILKERQELYFYFPVKPEELKIFNKILSLDGYNGKYAYAYATPEQFEKFKQTSKSFDIVHSYYDKTKNMEMASSYAEIADWDKYPTYELYVEIMQDFAQDFPEICRLDSIGYSHGGRLILYVHITSDIENPVTKPEFLYTGQMHGDELVSGFLFLRLIDYMLNNYGTHTQITKLIDELNIYINPYANPDATYYGGNHTVADSRRNNSQNIDLNRNFRDPLDGDHPDGNPWATETVLFMDFAEERNFVMSANSHSGAECMNYPFDTYSVLPADNDWWYFVCREYANHAQENSSSDYFIDLNNGVTHGYSWYSINGGRQDYMNYFHNCREVTLELSTQKKLDSNLLPAHWEYNRQAMLDYMEHATYGLRGFVSDSVTGLPLKAQVFIENHDFFNSQVYSCETFGDYYRLLFEGDYQVTFSADGYKSKSFEVNIHNYQQTLLDVELVNLDLLTPYLSFQTHQNVFTCNPEVQFYNTSEASQDSWFLWDFGDGNSSDEFSPIHIYNQNGIYNVKLNAGNSIGESELIANSAVTINLPELNNIQDGVICGDPASVELSLVSEETVFWYNNINDVEEIHIGNNYTSPIINENTQFFVQEFIAGEEVSSGEPNNNEGGSYNEDSEIHYLLFDCFQNCILKSVKVYASYSGEREIYLRNNLGENIYYQSIMIEEGEQILEMNIDLVPGEDYQLGCIGNNGLFRGFSGVFSNFDFPYTNDFVSIKRSNTTWWNDHLRYYSYFYDWTIKDYDCLSERTPVNVYYNEDVIAAFDYEADNFLISFTNTSVAAESYIWDFGDGSPTSTEHNPIHNYSQPGTYSVVLTAESQCGTDEFISPVVVFTPVFDESKPAFGIFPNPAKDNIYINTYNLPATIEVLNLQGRVLIRREIFSEKKSLDLSFLSKGIYFVILKTEEQSQSFKLLLH